MAVDTPALETQFTTLEQQHQSTLLGMWIFLDTEILLFGGLFVSVFAYRVWYGDDFDMASGRLNVLIGGVNTVVLLTSSLTMALAVHAALTGGRRLALWLVLTAVLGLAFLGLKGYEYLSDYREGLVPWTARFSAREWTEHTPPADPQHVALFLIFYYVMTGLHAVHLSVGIGLVVWLTRRAMAGRVTPDRSDVAEAIGLYWHFVDVVWIFLLPLLYLSVHHTPEDFHF